MFKYILKGTAMLQTIFINPNLKRKAHRGIEVGSNFRFLGPDAKKVEEWALAGATVTRFLSSGSSPVLCSYLPGAPPLFPLTILISKDVSRYWLLRSLEKIEMLVISNGLPRQVAL